MAALSSGTNEKLAETVKSRGFPPIAGEDARILVLGSMPGQRSIAEQQYYAHPRNAFWPIMQALYGIDGDYETRRRQLISRRVAVWDVLRSSVRPGSLDADIRLDVAKVNDFATFFRGHPDLRLVVFNGRKAESLFARFTKARPAIAPARFLALPSTSPAYASLPFSGKLDAWRQALSLALDH